MFELADYLIGIYKTDNCTKSITIDPHSFAVPASSEFPLFLPFQVICIHLVENCTPKFEGFYISKHSWNNDTSNVFEQWLKCVPSSLTRCKSVSKKD